MILISYFEKAGNIPGLFRTFVFMLDKEEILSKIKSLLKDNFKDRIQKVILFGSQARNNENDYSDFDVLIINKDSFSWEDKSVVRDICYDISLENDILIDSKIIDNESIENTFKGNHPLIADAINFGIHG